jgi:hypothetical protein
MTIIECKIAYKIIIDGVLVGTAQPSDMFLDDIRSTDDLYGTPLYHHRCWLTTHSEDEEKIAKTAHFVQLGDGVWFRNCSTAN